MGNEIFVFTGISVILSYVMLRSSKTWAAVSAGVLATISWYVTALWFMHDYVIQNPTAPAGLVFGRFFQLFAFLSLVITLAQAGYLLNPYHKDGGLMN